MDLKLNWAKNTHIWLLLKKFQVGPEDAMRWIYAEHKININWAKRKKSRLLGGAHDDWKSFIFGKFCIEKNFAWKTI